ncbi:Swt1 family HEPN domain-containing protein [Heliophilum fasciatum]|uniref:Swt1-like HEPN domain-containing protein n=1 Tax=Heliophilum fasciatum TaxID=35700 RepID=A0A4R2RHW2_9FIRM|nr:Swt1 family HEPN domain-containing protein [Heliophilum fasciatum]MCW2279026.1 hypothetical protein [Heliophilum fasciatum]TCP61737.1 hypothetical protein EDD73_1268 [Heliophilum fasciatum]
MESENAQVIFKALRVVTPALAHYVYRHLKNHFGEKWWDEGVYAKLREHQRRGLPVKGDDRTLLSKMDIHLSATIIVTIQWNDVFSKIVPIRFRTYCRELIDIRTFDSAHLGDEELDDRDVDRSMDTMRRIVAEINDQAAFDKLMLISPPRNQKVVEIFIEKPVEVIVEKPVEVIKEVIVEKPVEVIKPIEIIKETMLDVEKKGEKPKEKNLIPIRPFMLSELFIDFLNFLEPYREPIKMKNKNIIKNLLIEYANKVAGTREGDTFLRNLRQEFGGSLQALIHWLDHMRKIHDCSVIIDGSGCFRLGLLCNPLFTGLATRLNSYDDFDGPIVEKSFQEVIKRWWSEPELKDKFEQYLNDFYYNCDVDPHNYDDLALLIKVYLTELNGGMYPSVYCERFKSFVCGEK